LDKTEETSLDSDEDGRWSIDRIEQHMNNKVSTFPTSFLERVFFAQYAGFWIILSEYNG